MVNSWDERSILSRAIKIKLLVKRLNGLMTGIIQNETIVSEMLIYFYVFID